MGIAQTTAGQEQKYGQNVVENLFGELTTDVGEEAENNSEQKGIDKLNKNDEDLPEEEII